MAEVEKYVHELHAFVAALVAFPVPVMVERDEDLRIGVKLPGYVVDCAHGLAVQVHIGHYVPVSGVGPEKSVLYFIVDDPVVDTAVPAGTVAFAQVCHGGGICLGPFL